MKHSGYCSGKSRKLAPAVPGELGYRGRAQACVQIPSLLHWLRASGLQHLNCAVGLGLILPCGVQ